MRKVKAQSFMDYAVLITVIAFSVVVMSSYIMNSIKAKVHHLKRDLTDPVNGVR
jgi:hypothetical protein